MIDISIEQIQIKMTDAAIAQLRLIKENDYTMQELVFRLKIDGKGCHGFDYALGFSEKDPEDLIYPIQTEQEQIQLYLDPFTAYYCRQGTIDFITDYANDTEGFHFENPEQNKYRGKFFKNEKKIPQLKSE